MTVVHVEAGRHLYGGALQVLLLLRGLRSHAGRHVLICPADSPLASAAVGVAACVHGIPMAGDLDVLLLRRLVQLFREEGATIVHLHSRRGADLWGALAARYLGLPVVLTRRVDNPEPPWLVKRKYRLYQRVVGISRGIRDILVAEGVSPASIQVIPSAVDSERYRADCDRHWFRAAFSPPSDAILAGVVAQFIQRKGHDVLLDALPAVLAVVPGFRVLLFGRGPLEERFMSRVRKRGLEGHLIHKGFREDLHRVLPCLDMLVHPARMEGLGVSLLQAAACEIPVIASAVGGIPEAVEDGETGLLVPPNNPAALAGAIIELATDRHRARRMGAAGRRRVSEGFSIASMANAYRHLYEGLAVQSKS